MAGFNTPTRQVASNAIGVKSPLQNKIGYLLYETLRERSGAEHRYELFNQTLFFLCASAPLREVNILSTHSENVDV
jgi:hypothetical protein